MKKRIVLIITILFYMGMLLLSLTARRIHNAQLPTVKVVTLSGSTFYSEDGSVSYGTLLPMELYQDGLLYRVVTELRNGEPRNIAYLVEDLEIGRSNSEGFEVVNGTFFGDRIIASDLDEIVEGGEVYVEEEE